MSIRPSWRLFAAGALVAALAALAGYGAVLFLPKGRPPAEVTSPAAEADPQALARQAGDVLQTNCHRCHGRAGAMEGGFNYVTDRRRLVARKKIVPGDPDHSALLRRVLDGEMPPADVDQRPGPDDVAVLRRWIEAGAPDFDPPQPERPTAPLADLPHSYGTTSPVCRNATGASHAISLSHLSATPAWPTTNWRRSGRP